MKRGRGGAIAALTELSPPTVSPGPNRAVRRQRQAEIAAAGDCGHTGQVLDLAGRRKTAIPGDRPVSEFAVCVLAPGPGMTGRSRTYRDACRDESECNEHERERAKLPSHRLLHSLASR